VFVFLIIFAVLMYFTKRKVWGQGALIFVRMSQI